MPYVPLMRRQQLDAGRPPEDAGELNYVLTSVVNDFLIHRQNIQGDYRYQDLNDVVGALDNCKDEFKRRVLNPYEDDKIDQNGDVYSCLV